LSLIQQWGGWPSRDTLRNAVSSSTPDFIQWVKLFSLSGKANYGAIYLFLVIRQVAKGELASVRQTHPFELDIIDIYSDQGKPWRNRYAWWIPVLHLEGKEIAKGRWDQMNIREALEAWKKNNEKTP